MFSCFGRRKKETDDMVELLSYTTIVFIDAIEKLETISSSVHATVHIPSEKSVHNGKIYIDMPKIPEESKEAITLVSGERSIITLNKSIWGLHKLKRKNNIEDAFKLVSIENPSAKESHLEALKRRVGDMHKPMHKCEVDDGIPEY